MVDAIQSSGVFRVSCYIAVATVAATGTSTVFSLVNGKDA